MEEDKVEKTELDPTLTSFIEYCQANPSERFWQALRNWSDNDFLFFGNHSNRLGGSMKTTFDGVTVYLNDTFYFSAKNK